MPQYAAAGILRAIAQRPVTITSATATASNDPTVFYEMNSGSAQTLTIPTGMTRWPIGSIMTIVQLGAGAVSIAAAGGVTINTAASSLISQGQYNVIQLLNMGTDSWLAFGGLGG